MSKELVLSGRTNAVAPPHARHAVAGPLADVAAWSGAVLAWHVRFRRDRTPYRFLKVGKGTTDNHNMGHTPLLQKKTPGRVGA